MVQCHWGVSFHTNATQNYWYNWRTSPRIQRAYSSWNPLFQDPKGVKLRHQNINHRHIRRFQRTCRWLSILYYYQSANYLPMQKLAKIWPNISLSVSSPKISDKFLMAARRGSLTRSPEMPSARPCCTSLIFSRARTRAS